MRTEFCLDIPKQVDYESINLDLKEKVRKGVDWTDMHWDGDKRRAVVSAVVSLWVP